MSSSREWESRKEVITEEFERAKSKPGFTPDRVVASGVSQEEALSLANQVPIEHHVQAAIEESTQGEVLNRDRLRMNLTNLALVCPNDLRAFIEEIE